MDCMSFESSWNIKTAAGTPKDISEEKLVVEYGNNP